MSPDIESRLRAALRAGAELIDEPAVPAVPADFRPPDATPAPPARTARTNRRHRERWLVPASIAAAVAVIAACTIVVVRITASQQNGPVGPAVPTAVVPSVTSPSPTSERTSPTQGSRAVTTTPSRPVRSSRSGLAGTTPSTVPLTEPNRVIGGGRTAPSPVLSQTSAPALRTSSTGTGRQVTTGTQPVDAQLLGNGRGYVRTGSALLWTDDDGAHWRDITPPGLTPAQLQAAGVAVRSDGRAWVALSPKAGHHTTRVYRRSAAGAAWTTTSVPLGRMTITAQTDEATYLSFVTETDGWMMVTDHVARGAWGELFHTGDGGLTWTVQGDPSARPAVGPIHFLTTTIGVMDADIGTQAQAWWITRDAGGHWTKLKLPAPGKAFQPGVDAIFNGSVYPVDGAIVAAANVVVDLAGYDGTAIYRSTDGGKNWSLQSRVKPGRLGESWDSRQWFAVSPDGSSYVLLGSVPTTDGHGYTWVTSRSVNHGKAFTDVTSRQQMFVTGGQQPFQGALSVADSGEIWALGDTDTCGINTLDCGSPAALFASHDGGASWHRVSLPH